MFLDAFNELMMNAAEAFISFGCVIWNFCCNLCLYILGNTPQNMKPDAYNYVVDSLYPIFLALGVSLMSLFFVIGFLKESIDIRQALTLENMIMLFVRLVLANAVMASILAWLPRMFNWAANLVTQVAGISRNSAATLGTLSPERLMEDVAQSSILALFVGNIYMLVMAVCGFIILLTVYKRIFSLYLLLPMAPLALSTIAGGGGISHTAIAYMKNFLTICFECVVIAIILSIGGYFIGSGLLLHGPFQDTAASKMIESCLSATLISTSVKGTDTFIRRTFGF